MVSGQRIAEGQLISLTCPRTAQSDASGEWRRFERLLRFTGVVLQLGEVLCIFRVKTWKIGK